jgi:STE24 endopeptidase
MGGPGRRLLVAAAIVTGGAAWLLAVLALWRTSVPGGLNPSALDPSEYFSEPLLSEASTYTRFLDITDLLASLAVLVGLGIFAVTGARFARESAAGRIGTGMLLGMLALGFAWFARVPFGLAQVWWVRRHDVTEVNYGQWLVEDWLAVGAEFLFISLALLIVMGLAAVWRRAWWLAAVPALIAVALAFAFVQPYLFPGLDPVRDPELREDTRAIAAEQGISPPDVRIQDTFGTTKAPNAFAAGLGPSERVVLWDTLVDDFDRAETRVVLAHEVAHLSRGHIWKAVAWLGLLLLPIAFLTALATRRRGGMYEPGAVPVAVFVVALLFFVAAPLDRGFSKRLEAEADWIALETTRDPDAATSMFAEFTRTALIDPDPPAWSRTLLHGHPSIIRRIEMAEAWDPD